MGRMTNNPTPNTLVIGDIHGCWDEFQALLDLAGLGADDELLAVGDLVDRGPDSPRVLNFFRAPPAGVRARSVQGNHERKHVRSARGDTAAALSQVIARDQFGAAYPDALAFMDALPRWVELPHATVVHAFYEPGVPLHQQRETVIVGTLTGDDYLTNRYRAPWYTLYDGDRPLIVGHRDYSGVQMPFVYRERVWGIDTRCYHGGALTGLLLPAFRLLRVPARANHWAALQAAYAPKYNGLRGL